MQRDFLAPTDQIWDSAYPVYIRAHWRLQPGLRACVAGEPYMTEAQVCSSQPTSAWRVFLFQSRVSAYGVGQNGEKA
jgi:hypothetical protein